MTCEPFTLTHLSFNSREDNELKNIFKKFIVGVSALATVAIASTTAFASTSSLNSGSLSITTPTIGDFGAVTLNGQDEQTSASMGNFAVTDATGSGNGWNVVVKATQLTNSTNNNTLPLNSISLVAPTVAIDSGATGSSDPSTITVASGNIDTTSGLKLLSAALNGGMGSYDVSFPSNALTLNLQPGSAYAGTYTSTVTVNVTQGP